MRDNECLRRCAIGTSHSGRELTLCVIMASRVLVLPDGKTLDPVLVDCVDEGSRCGASVRDAIEVGDESPGHFGSGEVAIGHAEVANSVRTDSLSLRSVVSDSSVLREDGPALPPCECEPLHVDHFLVGGEAVVLGQSREAQPFCSQK